ncbi:MAG TPA: hypothetical protein PK743_11050 [Luteimonas sp.]|nr:hypothetical protein [Luteimonas sp.]HRP73158.1 hypothetical protein [Luteimonas sp.]
MADVEAGEGSMHSGIGEDVRPWSFFLPVALAVAVGMLLAGLVQRGVDAMLAGDDAAEMVGVDAAEPDAPAPQTRKASRSTSADGKRSVAAARQPVEPSETEPTTPEVAAEPVIPTLPGAIVAKRDGAPEACINGSIALRNDNGWQQLLENDAPVPCTEQVGSLR